VADNGESDPHAAAARAARDCGRPSSVGDDRRPRAIGARIVSLAPGSRLELPRDAAQLLLCVTGELEVATEARGSTVLRPRMSRFLPANAGARHASAARGATFYLLD
jgi:hypothetical protein